jgi:hypothetical protein
MAASHPHLFQQSVADENETCKLVKNHFPPDQAMLQWHPAVGGDIPTPNTKEIVVFSSFFQHGFGLPVCDFLCGLLDHYKTELVHLNPNSILQIAVFFHLCEAFLGIPTNFPLSKNYFFLKYQLSAANRKVIGVWAFKPALVSASLSSPRRPLYGDGMGHGSTVRTTNQASLPLTADSLNFRGHGVKNPHLSNFLMSLP